MSERARLTIEWDLDDRAAFGSLMDRLVTGREIPTEGLMSFDLACPLRDEPVAAGRPGAIDERPSGVWKCTEHGRLALPEGDAPLVGDVCMEADRRGAANCRWVELVYPASEEQ